MPSETPPGTRDAADRPPGVRVADSITQLDDGARGAVLVAGSHGGRYCGFLAADAGLRGVILNDAGGGRDDAGFGALAYLQALGVAAATVAHTSARIGDGADMLARGRLSHVNRAATDLGCVLGQPCAEAARRMTQGVGWQGEAPAYAEARVALAGPPLVIIACDSASLVTPEDAGAFVVTGSHGGILAGRPDYGLAAKAAAAVFNDAGVGIDDAGVARLAVLERQGVPAVTVGAASARIGDARSAWEDGAVSFANRAARAAGAETGLSVQAFAARLRAHLERGPRR